MSSVVERTWHAWCFWFCCRYILLHCPGEESNSQKAMARQLPNFSKGVFPVNLHDFTETTSRRRHILNSYHFLLCTLRCSNHIDMHSAISVISANCCKQTEGCNILVEREWWLSTIWKLHYNASQWKTQIYLIKRDPTATYWNSGLLTCSLA